MKLGDFQTPCTAIDQQQKSNNIYDINSHTVIIHCSLNLVFDHKWTSYSRI